MAQRIDVVKECRSDSFSPLKTIFSARCDRSRGTTGREVERGI